jgi:hypothetical protein
MDLSVEWPDEDESNREWISRKIESGDTVEYFIALSLKTAVNLLITFASIRGVEKVGLVEQLNQAAGVSASAVESSAVLGALIFGFLMGSKVGY